MEKILIITYYYKHKNAMASVRPTKLAKYFASSGNNVSVLTSNQVDTWTKQYTVPVADDRICEIYASEHRRWTLINKYLGHRRKSGAKKLSAEKSSSAISASSAKNARIGFKKRLKGYLSWLFYLNIAKQEDICMFKGLKAEYQRMGSPKYDTVIATYPTYGAFLMGMWLKRKKKCNQFIADFRDPLYNPAFRAHKSESKFDLNCLKRLCKYADKIVCVSDGIADGIRQSLPDLKTPISIITNGYDLDDINEDNQEIRFDSSKINFVYTGTLYHGKRCVSMLASTLRQLIDEGKIAKDDFSFEYAGPDFAELQSQLGEYGLEHSANDHGFVSRKYALAMQRNASALLLLTWNEKDYQGVIPGKLFEYMAYKTVPIIALITGDVKDSEVSTMITKTHSGCACESASADDIARLKEFVYKLFKREYSQNADVKEYCYEFISKKYLEFSEDN